MEVVIASTLITIVTNACLLWLLRQVYSFEEELHSVKDTLKRLESEKINTDMILTLIEKK